MIEGAFNPSFFNLGLVYARPEIFLSLAACVILMLDLLLNDAQRRWTGWLAIVSLIVTAVLVAVQPLPTKVLALGGLFELDRMAQVLKIAMILIVAAVFVYSTDYLQRRLILKGEYFVLGLFATVGGMVLISAASLITLYLGLELMSLCLYAMVAFDRDSGIAAESAIKYFVLGSMASGTLLYGMSIVYGVTGQLGTRRDRDGRAQCRHRRKHWSVVRHCLLDRRRRLQIWRGAVSHVDTGRVRRLSHLCDGVHRHGFQARGVRAGDAAVAGGAGHSQPDWGQMLVVLSVLSMTIGNIVAIAQTNLKRMLAYSTISHVGYVLLGILSGTAQGYQAAMFYMISYILVAAGAFGMILLLAKQGFEADKITDFKGLNARSPWFAGMMAILMFSLAGVPPFIGFWAKLGVIQAVLGVHMVWLAVVAVLFSVVGAYFYLRIVKLMYFDEPTETSSIGGSLLMRTVLSANALLVFALGVIPRTLLQICQRALQ